MTYNVFSGTLNLTQSINQAFSVAASVASNALSYSRKSGCNSGDAETNPEGLAGQTVGPPVSSPLLKIEFFA